MSTGSGRRDEAQASCGVIERTARAVDARLYGDRALERGQMVVEALARKGVRDPRVLQAFALVPRHHFVPGVLSKAAYEPRPLAIGHDQVTADPLTVARALELAAPAGEDVALHVGAGRGYQTALLAELCAEVFAIERIPQLASRALRTLRKLGHHNAHVGCFDGSSGWAEQGPFDVILLSAACDRVPPMLLHQLAPGGRLVAPIIRYGQTHLTRVSRLAHGFATETDAPCACMTLGGRFGLGAPVAQA